MQTFMFPTRKTLGAIPGVAAGALLTAKIPVTGKKYGFFLIGKTAGGVLLTAAQLKADIGDIVVRVNGEPFIEASATQLLVIQKYFGDSDVAGNVAGVVPIFLYPRDLATYEERKALAWGTVGLTSITLEVKITGVAQLASLELFEYSSDENEVLGTHMRIRRYPHTFATTGAQDISDLTNNQPDMAYRALIIEKNTADITNASCRVNNAMVYDQVPECLNDVLNEDGGRKAQAGYYVMDFGNIRDLRGMLPMKDITDFRQQIVWATNAPTNYNIIALQFKGLK